MKFTLEIDCDNSAFEPIPEAEVASLLRKLADQIEHEPPPWPIFDINGNRVGTARFIEEEA
jgi:hypothetical protein